MREVKILNDIEYRRTTIFPNIWIAADGSYIIPEGRNPTLVRYGTKNYNKNGYPLQVMVCNCYNVVIDGIPTPKRHVVNLGRLVLDAWCEQVDPTLEVDHIDRNPFNNNVNNLRLTTKKGNAMNKKVLGRPWLHTPEANAKREASKKAKREGTYVYPEKHKKNGISFEESVRIKRVKKAEKHNNMLINNYSEIIDYAEKEIQKEYSLLYIAYNDIFKRKTINKRTIDYVFRHNRRIDRLNEKVTKYKSMIESLARAA